MGIPEQVIEELRGRVLLSDLVQRSGVELRQAVVTLVLDSVGMPEEYRKAGKGKANAENQRG